MRARAVSTPATLRIGRPRDQAVAAQANFVPAPADAHRQVISIASSTWVAAAVRDQALGLPSPAARWQEVLPLNSCTSIRADSTAADRAVGSVRAAAISLAIFQEIALAPAAAENSSVREKAAKGFALVVRDRAVGANSSDQATTLVPLGQGRAVAVSSDLIDRTVRVKAVKVIAPRDPGRAEVANRGNRDTGRIALTDRTVQAKAAAASVGPVIVQTGFQTGTSGAIGGTIIIAMCGTIGTTIGTTTGTTAITGTTTTGGITTTGTTRTTLVSTTGALPHGPQ
jgi:hypothetical protein